jgi:hypothetical protein
MVTMQKAGGNQAVTEKSDGENFYNKGINKKALTQLSVMRNHPVESIF